MELFIGLWGGFCGRGEGIGWWKLFMETVYGGKLWKQCMNALPNQLHIHEMVQVGIHTLFL